MLCASVVRGINEDTLHLSGVGRQKCFQGDQVVSVNDEVIVQRWFFARSLALYCGQFMEFHRMMVILNDGFSFEVKNGHSESENYFRRSSTETSRALAICSTVNTDGFLITPASIFVSVVNGISVFLASSSCDHPFWSRSFRMFFANVLICL